MPAFAPGKPFDHVASFATRTPARAHVDRARLLAVDVDVAEVELHGQRRYTAAFAHAAADRLHDVLVECDARDVRVECDVCDGEVVGVHLRVNQSTLSERLERSRGVRGEAALVALLREVWREATVHAAAARAQKGVGDENEHVEEDEEDGGKGGEERPEGPGDPGEEETCGADDAGVGGAPETHRWPLTWNDDVRPLWSHQRATVAWMRETEARRHEDLAYPCNLHVGAGWYVDTERECFTRDPDVRFARVRGAVCADGYGAGKTAALLRLVAETRHAPWRPTERPLYASAATLVVAPRNVVGQWIAEARRCLVGARVVVVTTAHELREVSMRTLCEEADLVITSLHFLRASRAYAMLCDSATGHKPKTRAVLSAWERQPNHTEPLLEAVRWRRLVVDEAHEAFASARALQQLRLFDPGFLWGLTATPPLASDAAHALYALLAKEKAHHPNLLAALAARAVRVGGGGRAFEKEGAVRDVAVREGAARDGVRLTRVRLTAEELARAGSARGGGSGGGSRAGACDAALQETIRRTTARSAGGDAPRGTVTRADACGECGARPARVLTPCLHFLCVACAEEDAARTGACPVCDAPMPPDATRTFDAPCGVGTKLDAIAALLRSLGEGAARSASVVCAQWRWLARDVRAHLAHAGAVARAHVLEGTPSQRTATLADFAAHGGALVLCVEDGFAGLDLPHVDVVVFAHAFVGPPSRVRHVEREVVGRCARVGRMAPLRVYAFVVADGDEEDHWRSTHLDDDAYVSHGPPPETLPPPGPSDHSTSYDGAGTGTGARAGTGTEHGDGNEHAGSGEKHADGGGGEKHADGSGGGGGPPHASPHAS